MTIDFTAEFNEMRQLLLQKRWQLLCNFAKHCINADPSEFDERIQYLQEAIDSYKKADAIKLGKQP